MTAAPRDTVDVPSSYTPLVGLSCCLISLLVGTSLCYMIAATVSGTISRLRGESAEQANDAVNLHKKVK